MQISVNHSSDERIESSMVPTESRENSSVETARATSIASRTHESQTSLSRIEFDVIRRTSPAFMNDWRDPRKMPWTKRPSTP